MRFGIIENLLSDPRATLIVLLLALPGRMLAICAHEAAHGWVAEKCGDPTARYAGRITLNPMKHLDPIGIICFMLLGIGWARPVPVNPRNYRHGRRDDLAVSLAGIGANLIMFLAGTLVTYAIVFFAFSRVPQYGLFVDSATGLFRHTINGTAALVTDGGWYSVRDLLNNAPYVSDVLIKPLFGNLAGWCFDMLGYFITCNLMLAIFNLIPVPPLDGYHVLNDLLLRRARFFASPRAARICMMVLYIGVFTGVVSQVLGWVHTGVFSVLGQVAFSLLAPFGLY